MVNTDSLAENHYQKFDPAFFDDDSEFFEHEELLEEAMRFEIDLDDEETIRHGIQGGIRLMKKLDDDDYDALEHIADEIDHAQALLLYMS